MSLADISWPLLFLCWGSRSPLVLKYCVLGWVFWTFGVGGSSVAARVDAVGEGSGEGAALAGESARGGRVPELRCGGRTPPIK